MLAELLPRSCMHRATGRSYITYSLPPVTRPPYHHGSIEAFYRPKAAKTVDELTSTPPFEFHSGLISVRFCSLIPYIDVGLSLGPGLDLRSVTVYRPTSERIAHLMHSADGILRDRRRSDARSELRRESFWRPAVWD